MPLIKQNVCILKTKPIRMSASAALVAKQRDMTGKALLKYPVTKAIMKTGKTLHQLADALVYQREHSKDYIVPTAKLSAKVVEEPSNEGVRKVVTLGFTNGEDNALRLNEWSRGQLATYTDIPKTYFDRIATENPELAAKNINHGLNVSAHKVTSSGKPEGRMVRMLKAADGTRQLRALLSPSYRILDSYDLLETVLPVAADQKLQVVSSEITDRRLFVKLLSPKLQTEIKKGDMVQYGLTISTSDVGAGSVRVEPLVYRLVCSNGMISNTAMRKYHVGRSQSENDIQELLSDKTKEISDQAFWLQVRDLVLSSLKPDNFEREVNRLRVAADLQIKNFDLPEVVELSMRAVGLSGETKAKSILHALASGNEGAGLTQYGLINAFTKAAQADEFSYEQSIEMERAAGAILELAPKDWHRIAEVAA